MSPARHNQVSREVMEIAIAWVLCEISTSEAQERLGCKRLNLAVYRMGIALRQACRDKVAKVTRK